MATHLPVLDVHAVCKRYAAQPVLSDVSLAVHGGEVHALLGGNGAGKSTLLKILAGSIAPDSGIIRVDGRPARFRSPAEALRGGVALVHQEPALAPDLTVAENISLGREPRRAAWLPFIDQTRLETFATDALRRVGFPIDVRTPVAYLSMAQRQMVDIARAVAAARRVVLLDEPTAALSPKETDDLFATIARLQHQGLALVYVTHRLDEVARVATHVTILRDGRVAHAGTAHGLSHTAMVQHIVGRPPTDEFPARGASTARVRLRVCHLSAPGRFAPISIDVHAGEIVGLAGLPDAGCRDVLECVFSSQSTSSGTVEIDGHTLAPRTPRASLAAGMALLTDDRLSRGLCLERPLRENISLAALALQPLHGRALRRTEDAMTAEGMARCDIRPAAPEQPMTHFSGGNQQKALLARWLAAGSHILLLSEPTRGVDVGARADLYRQWRALADDGAALLVQSSDFRELLGLADRVLVMRRGALVGEFRPDAITEQQLLSLASVGEVAS